jgi:hypothetical protein
MSHSALARKLTAISSQLLNRPDTVDFQAGMSELRHEIVAACKEYGG